MISYKSNIKLDNNYYEKIKEIIEWQMLSIRKDYLNDYIPPNSYEDYLITISEVLPLLSDEMKEEFIEIGYCLAKGIKHKLEYDFENYKTSSMFIGLGYSAFSIYSFNKMTGLLEKFMSSLNKLLLDEAYNKVINLQTINEDKGTKDFDYDLIYGISGTLNYLLEFDWNEENNYKIIKLGEYLISLCSDCYFEGYTIPRFYIKYENLKGHIEMERFPNGCLNFGMAHGMLAPLISISKLKLRDTNIKYIDNAVEKILNLFDEFVNKDKGYYVWPTQISPDDYIKKSFDAEYSQNGSWCYGGTSIANGLKTVYKNLKNEKLVHRYNDILKKILNINFKEYKFYTPILCHGHASILSVITTIYSETNDENYLYNLKNTLDEIFLLFDPTLKYGFKTFDSSEIVDGTSFLEGNTGIILSLISLFSGESTYKKLLLS